MHHRFLPRIAVTLATLAVCLSSHAAGPRIGVLLKGKNDFWTSVEKGAQGAATELGATLVIKVPPAEGDIPAQVAMLQELAAAKLDALVVAPSSKDAIGPGVAALAAKGVKIVVIDSMLPGVPNAVFVGTNHRAAGEAAGRLVADLVADGDQVSIFRHDKNGGATEQRELGAMIGLKMSRPGLVVHGDVYASTEPGKEKEHAETLLKQYPDSKAILAAGTPGTMALLGTISQSPLSGHVRFVGFGFNLNPDVNTAIEKGVMDAWVAQLPRLVGYKGVASAVALVTGEEVDKTVNTPFLVVTRKNLHDPSIQALMKI